MSVNFFGVYICILCSKGYLGIIFYLIILQGSLQDATFETDVPTKTQSLALRATQFRHEMATQSLVHQLAFQKSLSLLSVQGDPTYHHVKSDICYSHPRVLSSREPCPWDSSTS